MRFRFTIRDLLWLTVVAALATGWWLHWRRFVDLEQRYSTLEQSTSVVQLRVLEKKLLATELDVKVMQAAMTTADYEMARMKAALDGTNNGSTKGSR